MTTVAGTCLTNGGGNHHGNLSAMLVSASVDSTLRVWLRHEPAGEYDVYQHVCKYSHTHTHTHTHYNPYITTPHTCCIS